MRWSSLAGRLSAESSSYAIGEALKKGVEVSTSGPQRAALLLCTVAMAAALALGLLAAASKPAGAATDVLPDLRMAKLQDLKLENTSDGRKILRFSSIVVNVGVGAFEMGGQRPDTSISTMTTTQRIFNDAGGYRDVATNAVMYYSGDGHNHWHVRDLEEYVLRRQKNGRLVGTGAKHGFCFYDNYRFGSTQDPFYTRQMSPPACGQYPSDLKVTMGLLAGWGDKYGYTLPDQYIDVTGLTSGRYRLRATADADNWFSESNNSNNFTWVNIRLSGDSVSVIRYGPSAQPLSG